MTDKEFEMEVRKGVKKLVILDDLILDITNFTNSHPGGRFLLEKNTGRDISKYFHGGYSYEPIQKASNHKHSNYARTIVNDLIVARFVAKRGTSIMSAKAQVQDDDAPRDIRTYKFVPRGDQNLASGMSNFYPDLTNCGKHYLVQRVNEAGKLIDHARQYTVAASMDQAVYGQTVKALEAHGTDNAAKETQELERVINAGRNASEIKMTIKDYKLKGALSSAIANSANSDLFQVSGPIGRSLNIDTAGLNIAFVAGTGILPFMDLVSYVARRTLDLQNVDSASKESLLDKGFHLWMCSRMNPREPIGHELLSSLATCNKSQFSYDQVTKEVQAQNWNTELIASKLEQVSRD